MRVLWTLLAFLFSVTALADKPRVASMNLCTDRLVMALADAAQIASLSHVAADPDSMVETASGNVPLNHGQLEEMLNVNADVIVASDYDSPRVLGRLTGFGRRVELFPTASTLEQVKENIRHMAMLLDQPQRGEAAIARIHDIESTNTIPGYPRTLIMGANGYVSGPDSLAGHLIEALGYDNLADEAGISQSGQISIEQAIMLAPEVLILNQYSNDYSRAQAVLDHPALTFLGKTARVLHVPTREWICGDTALVKVAQRLTGK